MKLILITGRTLKQGCSSMLGKDSPDYLEETARAEMNREDLDSRGLKEGDRIKARTDAGVALFTCQEGKVPRGIIFVPYGPLANQLVGTDTQGSGMPSSKGVEVEVEPAEKGLSS
ncbi:formylmethanofuran dehydrogenase subunit D [Candidatus Hakubella thermalkaliphila]|nr:molybdopterin dinucleotide binding domain-containing protein [Candidatus Hakubella thermalkaliphila]GFP28058.1 formylmethanofuran dehydrogenase subunit D [Candidatus Hakubella thermalkaliphila]GFP34859.1 formylmethanofuran dehydrogenase subunit D [Candidatus Hakubella thermalkaliphila]